MSLDPTPTTGHALPAGARPGAAPDPRPVTEHLVRWNEDPKTSLDQVLPWVEGELRRMAQSFLDGEGPGHTLQATALVHELYLRLLGRRSGQWRDRSHFFGFAARTMRRILVDHARERQTAKRGGGLTLVALHEQLDGSPGPSVAREGHAPGGLDFSGGGRDSIDLDLLALDHALERLERLDPRLHQIVELRFFAGLTTAEIAEVLGVGTATVQRGWASARAWLHRNLEP